MVTVPQARTRGMTLMRMPADDLGHFHRHYSGAAAFPALFVACVMLLFDRLLGTSFFMPALISMGEQTRYWRRQPDSVPASVLVFWPS